MMPPDPIVEEIRKIRAAHAEKFGHDLAAICKELKSREKDPNHPLVRRAPKLRLRKTGS